MTYKIWRSNELKRKLERKHGPFDVVIRMRPDLILDGANLEYVVDAVRQGRMLVTGWDSETSWVNDVFAAARSDIMDAYSSIFARTVLIPQEWKHIHKELFHLIRAITPEVENLPFAQRFAADPLITLEQLSGSLHEMRADSARWSAAHEVAFCVSTALTAKRLSGATQVIDRLRACATAATTAGLDATDNFFIVLCENFQELGETKAAAVCALAVMPWPMEVWETCRKIAVGAFLGAFHTYVAEKTGPVTDFGDWLLADGEKEWLHALLQSLADPSPLAGWLRAKIRLAFEDPGIAEDVVIEWNHRQQHDRADEIGSGVDFGDTDRADVAAEHREALALAAPSERDGILTELRRAVELSPNNVELLYGLAHELKLAGHYGEARDVQSRAVAAAPRHSGANRQLAEICLLLGEFETALEYAETAFALEPSMVHRVLVGFVSTRLGSGASKIVLDRPTGRSLRHSDLMRIPGFADFLAGPIVTIDELRV